MQAYRLETTVSKDGSVVLKQLPFRAGEEVEVIVLAREPQPGREPYPLRGKPIRYDRPTDPVAEADWESLA
jgi:hypothetical protein